MQIELKCQIHSPSMDRSRTNVGVRRRQGMTTITGRMESGEATMAVAYVGMTKDIRLLEESPMAVYLQKGIKPEQLVGVWIAMQMQCRNQLILWAMVGNKHQSS